MKSEIKFKASVAIMHITSFKNVNNLFIDYDTLYIMKDAVMLVTK